MCVNKVEYTVYITIITPTLIANLLGFVYNMVEKINNNRSQISKMVKTDSSGMKLKRHPKEDKLLIFDFARKESVNFFV